MKRLTIQSLFPKSMACSQGATDYLYFHDLKQMEDKYPVCFRQIDPVGFRQKQLASRIFFAGMRRIPGLRSLSTSWRHAITRPIHVSKAELDNADILYSNYWFPRKKIQIPFVLEADFVPYGSTESDQSQMRRILRIPDRMIAMCDAVIVRTATSADHFRQLYPWSKARVEAIRHYMPYITPASVDSISARWNTNDPLRVLFVANMPRLKNLPRLVQAIELLRAGMGESGPCLEVISNFLDGEISLPPWVDVKHNVDRKGVEGRMRVSHIMALPTSRDSFGKVFCEAMAAGCVLLAPKWYPLGEDDYFGTCGECVDVFSVKSITDGLRRLLVDRQASQTIALRNRKLFDKLYDADIVSRQYFSLFQELCR
ncbi:MAG: hypothetical protein GWP14_05745 [Actinobacteria bacterium]|nr:hypothetical protein [Actinomycetota bacterium]